MNLTFGCYVKKKTLENLLKVDKKLFFYIVSTQLDILSYYDDHRQSYLSGRGAPAPPPPYRIPLFVRNKLGLGETGPFIINMKGLEVIVVYFTTF